MALGKTLMIQGTASNVGKSVLTAAFCRLLLREGYRVAPFKAQNMSNNSFVTRDGGEIGRAQAVQAEACVIEPTVLMNPILLKPSSDMQAQVVVKGEPVARIRSIGHPDYQKRFQPVVRESLDALRGEYDVVVIEGAGSPAEMNLKARDIVNMSVARYASSPVILVGDIDWGGIFAQLVGTYELLDPEEKSLVKAFLINKFRGNPELLKPGLDWIEERTRTKVLGVVPYISDLEIAEEDSIAGGDSGANLAGLRSNVCLDAVSGKGRDHRQRRAENHQLLVDVVWLPHLSNFTDFEALQKEPDLVLRYLHEPDRHALPDLLILPGTKSTAADLAYLKKTGMDAYIRRAAQAGVPILGICGGYQMLGESLEDRLGVESEQAAVEGLGLLPVRTAYEPAKTKCRVRACHYETGEAMSGYEIHMGQTCFTGAVPAPFARVTSREGSGTENERDGIWMPNPFAVGAGSWIAGTYLHGLFDEAGFRRTFLNRLRKSAGLREPAASPAPCRDVFDRLADKVAACIDRDYLKEILR